MSLRPSANVNVQLLPTPQAPPASRPAPRSSQRRRDSITRGYTTLREGAAVSSWGGTAAEGTATTSVTEDSASTQPKRRPTTHEVPRHTSTASPVSGNEVEKEVVQWIAEVYDTRSSVEREVKGSAITTVPPWSATSGIAERVQESSVTQEPVPPSSSCAPAPVTGTNANACDDAGASDAGTTPTEHDDAVSARSPVRASFASTTRARSLAVPAPTVAPHPSPKIAWKCGLCGYLMLAMDQSGNPLPFATSAFGHPLPLTCPRCQLEHTDWQPAAPFDEHGDHANIRSKLSNKYVELLKSSPGVDEGEVGQHKEGRGSSVGTAATHPTPHHTHSLVPAPKTSPAMVGSLLHREFRRAAMPELKPMCYYCSFCQRRLLRVDVAGELIEMDRDKDGNVLPILCPGCNRVHNEWRIRPFQVHPPPTASSQPPLCLH